MAVAASDVSWQLFSAHLSQEGIGANDIPTLRCPKVRSWEGEVRLPDLWGQGVTWQGNAGLYMAVYSKPRRSAQLQEHQAWGLLQL